MATTRRGATSIVWGPINWQDASEDLVVSTGSKIKIYRNSNADTLISSPLITISASASKIVVAQMNQNLNNPNQNDRFDIVGFDGKEVSIYYNSNNNDFDTLQLLTASDDVSDIAVGDLNNDGWNDLVIGYLSYTPQVEVFLNDGYGRLETSPTYSFEASCCYTNVLVGIADFGGPNTDSTRNDSWNDIIVGSHEGRIGILINTGSSPYFEEEFAQEQSIGVSGYESLKQIRIADVQNKGGQSVIASIAGGGFFQNAWSTGRIHLFKHAGNSAPAPPLGISAISVPRGYGNYNDAKITWRANIERDLAGYALERRITGVCGNGNWCVLAQLDESTTEYIDELSTVGGNNCLAKYRVKAFDAEDHYSDPSAVVQIAFGSDIWKANADQGNKPRVYALHPAFPNPFNPSTQIKFDLPEDSFVSLNAFDVLGRKVGEITNGNYAAGYHSATWDASKVASGVYFARFTATDGNGNIRLNKVTKLLLTK